MPTRRGCCRTSISPSMGRSWRRGPVRRVSPVGTGRRVRRRPAGTRGGNFRGERRTNATHQSTTDPDARLYKKGVGRPAQLAYAGHLCVENRSSLIVATRVTPADGFGERDGALLMAETLPGGRITFGLDKG